MWFSSSAGPGSRQYAALCCRDDDPARLLKRLADVQPTSLLPPAISPARGTGGPALTPAKLEPDFVSCGQVGEPLEQVAHGDAAPGDDHQVAHGTLNHSRPRSARSAACSSASPRPDRLDPRPS